MNLQEIEVLFLDCQTTGASPANGHLLEISWCLANAKAISKNPEALNIESFVLALPKGEELPRRISQITGIAQAEAEAGHSSKKIRQSLMNLAAPKKAVNAPKACIIHYAKFEKSFVDDLTKKKFPLTLVCTHEIAKRLYPDLPSKGIRALAGYYGLALGELKRSPTHVKATMLIWSRLLDELAQKNLNTLAELKHWLANHKPEKSGKRQYPMEKNIRLTLPKLPGVYRFLGPGNQILYVGKATSLQARVNSYFRGQKGRQPRQLEMLTQARDLNFTTTETVTEAALLESDEIKIISPPYNVALKRDHDKFIFCRRDFMQVAANASEEFCYGPFLEEQLAPLYLLAAAIKEKDFSQAAELFYGLDDKKMIKAGIKLFMLEYGLDASITLRELLMLGMMHLREERGREDTEEEDDDDDDSSLEEFEWDEEIVAHACLSHLARTAGFYRRAKALAALAHSEVFWPLDSTQSQWRQLQMQNGIIVHRQTHEKPPEPGRQGASKELLTYCDRLTYDRLRILHTELQVMRKNGVIPVVY